jgi:hypothetical protein
LSGYDQVFGYYLNDENHWFAQTVDTLTILAFGDTTLYFEADLNNQIMTEIYFEITPIYHPYNKKEYYIPGYIKCDSLGNVLDECGVCNGENECLSVNELIIPDHYSISNIYPNPFNPITSITYGLPEVGNVTLNVYNIQGRQVQTLVDDFQTAGYHSINWNASYYPSGVYLIRMESGSFTQTQKVVLVK